MEELNMIGRGSILLDRDDDSMIMYVRCLNK